MKSLIAANSASLSVVLTAAGLIALVYTQPGGGPGTWVAILAGLFSLSFVWMLIFRLRVVLADPERRWRELLLLAGNFAGMLLVFAWVHHEIGLVDLSGGAMQGTRDFSDALYFSVVTLTTLGFGDFIPSGAGRAIAAMQGLLGYVILGILVSTGFQLIAPHTEPSLKPGQDQSDQNE